MQVFYERPFVELTKSRIVAGSRANRVMSVLNLNSDPPVSAIPFRIGRSISNRVLGSKFFTDRPEVPWKVLQSFRKESLRAGFGRKHVQNRVTFIRIFRTEADGVHADGVKCDVITLLRCAASTTSACELLLELSSP